MEEHPTRNRGDFAHAGGSFETIVSGDEVFWRTASRSIALRHARGDAPGGGQWAQSDCDAAHSATVQGMRMFMLDPRERMGVSKSAPT